jgi:hypothetical protein
MLNSKEMSEKEAAQIGNAVSSSVEEVQPDTKAEKGAIIFEQDAVVKLKQMAREYGAERGQEFQYIEEHLNEKIEWSQIDDNDIAKIKTRFLSAITPRV